MPKVDAQLFQLMLCKLDEALSFIRVAFEDGLLLPQRYDRRCEPGLL
jgi:hypothetical protein